MRETISLAYEGPKMEAWTNAESWSEAKIIPIYKIGGHKLLYLLENVIGLVEIICIL